MLNIMTIKEMEIKTTVRFHFTPIRMAIIITLKMKNTNTGKHVKQVEPSYIAGKNIK